MTSQAVSQHYAECWAREIISINASRNPEINRLRARLPLPLDLGAPAPRPGLYFLFDYYRQIRNPESRHRAAHSKLLEIVFQRTFEPEIELPFGQKNVISCSEAERLFYATMQQIKHRKDRLQNRVSVYYDSNGDPVILRKSYQESTGLLLKHAVVAGLALPPGTLVSVTPTEDTHPDSTGSFTARYAEYASYELDGSIAIKPARPTAWSFEDDKDKALFAIEDYDSEGPVVNNEALRRVLSSSVTDFQLAAQRVMQMCGVAA